MGEPDRGIREKRLAQGLLVAGALAGLLAAIWGVFNLDTGENFIGAELAVAVVDGVSITRADYERALQALGNDKRNPLSDEDRARVLRLLIDEQLLVQRGVDINLVEVSPEVRKALVDAMLQYILVDTTADEASEEDLLEFYEENKGLFAVPARVHVRHLYVRPGTEEETTVRLEGIRSALEDVGSVAEFTEVAYRLGDDYFPAPPDGLLSPGKLRDYLGIQLTDKILELPEGGMSTPLKTDTGWHVFYVVERLSNSDRAFEEVRRQVAVEYQRFLEEKAFTEYLDWLYNRADVRIVEDEGATE